MQLVLYKIKYSGIIMTISTLKCNALKYNKVCAKAYQAYAIFPCTLILD